MGRIARFVMDLDRFADLPRLMGAHVAAHCIVPAVVCGERDVRKINGRLSGIMVRGAGLVASDMSHRLRPFQGDICGMQQEAEADDTRGYRRNPNNGPSIQSGDYGVEHRPSLAANGNEKLTGCTRETLTLLRNRPRMDLLAPLVARPRAWHDWSTRRFAGVSPQGAAGLSSPDCATGIILRPGRESHDG